MFKHFEFNPFTAIFGAIFGLCGLVAAIWGGFVLKSAKVSGSWPSVQGFVMESRVESKTSKGSDNRQDTSYYAKVVYRYEIETAEYTCDTVSFGEHGTNKPDHAREIVKRYPKGKEVKVYYDPEKPKTAVLEPGVTWSSYLPLGLGIVFVGVGVACCFSRR